MTAIAALCIASHGKNCAVGMLKLTTDQHEASRDLSATAELLVFIWATLPQLIKLIGWWIDVLSLVSSQFTFTQLHAILLSFVETSTQMMALLMLSKPGLQTV